MNIFYTNTNPYTSAHEHCKVHRVKMIVEYAQLLSTAHRLLDGEPIKVAVQTDKGYRIKDWYLLPSDTLSDHPVHEGYHELLDKKLYNLTHKNHPSAIWVRQSEAHYRWLFFCFTELCNIYEADSQKKHKTSELIDYLPDAPRNIPFVDFFEPPVAAPDQFKAIAVLEGAAKGYQAYLNDKFSEWKQRERPMKVDFICKPEWYVDNL